MGYGKVAVGVCAAEVFGDSPLERLGRGTLDLALVSSHRLQSRELIVCHHLRWPLGRGLRAPRGTRSVMSPGSREVIASCAPSSLKSGKFLLSLGADPCLGETGTWSFSVKGPALYV